MDAPSDHSKKDRHAKDSPASEPAKSLDALPRPRSRPRPPADVKDWDLPGIKKRPSLAPPAPPPSHAPPAPTTHELFDVETAAVDYERDRASQRAAVRASARPHPPRPSQKSISDAEADGGAHATGAASGADPVQRLSTPLSWAASKDPLEEVPDDLLEPVVDSAPLVLPTIASSEPLASAIPTGSVVTPPTSPPTKKRSGALAVAALGAAGLLTVGWFVSSRDGSKREAFEQPAERVAAAEQQVSEANPALRVPLPPLELDIGVPTSEPIASAAPSVSASAPTDPSSVPPVAPKGILPEKPEQPPAEALPPFDSAAATAALSQAAASVAACRKDGDPTGSATVIVRYAPSGRVTSSTVEAGPFAGTVTGGCIATTFRKARVPAFSGDYVTVKKTVSIR
jgi:hypothetical protein